MCTRKTIGFLIVLFCSTSALLAQMSGSYTVGSGGDYITISDAIADINSQGLSGDVTLNISAGTYVEYVDLSNLNNGSFAVTLLGEDLETTSISPLYKDVTPTTGIDLQDTDNITISNLTIRMPFESATATQEMFGIYVEDASSISVENTIILSVDGIEVVRGNNLDIFNNIVSAEGIAFEARDCDVLDLIHNTFHSNQTGLISGPNVGTQAVVRFEADNGNVSLTNNIFSGVIPDEPNGNAAIAVLNNLENLQISTNFNLFDADLSMAVFGESGNTNVNGTTVFEEYSLTDWKALGLDMSSQSLSPTFLEDTDFRIGNEDFRFGTYLPEFATDIDGETRVEGSVDVGADQYCITFEVSESIGACETYEFAGLTLTESGEYFGELVASNGCDSLVTLNLTILEPTAGNDEITAEGSYDWNGIVYSESGTYEQTLTNQAGCDSVATLNLTIEPYFLEGSFVIGSSDEADFERFEEAITDLQFATLIGDVDYTVEAGTYNETLKISEINSGDHSISFIGENQATTILHPMGSIDASGAGILINGTNGVTIQNLTLEMDDISDAQVSISSNDTKGISIVDAEGITLDNLSLRNDSEVSDYSSSQFYISSGLSITNVNELTVSNSSFSGSGGHITLGDHSNVDILENTFQTAVEIIRNDPGPTGNNLLIEHNDFNGPFERAIYLYELEDVSVLSNVIDGVDQTKSFEGIYLDLTSGSAITGNIVTNIETGIYFRESNTGEISQNKVFFTSVRALYLRDVGDLTVTNNFFGDLVYVQESIVLDFVNNTVVASSDRDQAVLVEYPSSLSGVTHSFINNIIEGGDQIETLVGVVDLTDPAVLTMDHNLYYLDDESGSKSLVTYEVNVGGDNVVTTYATLTEWQNALSFDQNSQSFAPVFADTDDFHITSGTNYRFGTYINTVRDDIDGENRTGLITDVGADQYKSGVILSGEYVIGTAAGADYATIDEALTEYRDANITGDVTFLLQAETFAENVDLGFLNNTDHHLTIKGSDRENSVIQVSEGGTIQLSQSQINLGGDPNGGAGIGIDESSNITLENFTLRGSVTAYTGVSAGIYAWDSESITIKSVNFEDVNNYSIYSRNSGSMSIEDCIFRGAVDEAIFDFLAQSGSTLIISGNEFSNYLIRAVQVNSLNASVIANENSFESSVNSLTAFQSDVEILASQHTTFLNNTSSDGRVYIQTDQGSLVSGNRITSEDGIALGLFSGGVQSVYNNFFRSITTYGFQDASGHTNFIHNTVIGTQGSSFNFFGTAANGDQLNVVNNILVGEGGPSLDFSVSAESGLMNLDHNLIYSDIDEAVTTNVFQLDGVSISPATFTLAEWKAVYSGSFDQNSQSFAPVFEAADDFHITSTNYRFGTFLADYATDIDGETRLEGSVDVGADQFCVSIEVTESVEACESYEFDGLTLTESGEYFGKFVALNGCDSLVTLNLTILEPTTSEENVEACESYDWNGVTYDVSGTYQEMFVNAAGCDSTATLNLTILEPTSGEESVAVCESYEWNNNIFTVSGTYQEVLMNAAGCDSTATLNLTILEPTTSEESVEACVSYDWNGVTYDASGTYQEMFLNAAGCDSTATLNLTILEATSSEENAIACGSFEWNGVTYISSGTYEEMFVNAVGCDSTATLNLIISESTACAPLSANDINEIIVSPNPTSGWIKVQGVENNVEYHVSDLAGRVIQQGMITNSKLLIDAEAGAYILTIPSVNKVVRIIKLE